MSDAIIAYDAQATVLAARYESVSAYAVRALIETMLSLL
jgi:hypothetical protein